MRNHTRVRVVTVLSVALLIFAFAVLSLAVNCDSRSKGEKLRIFVATRGTVPIPWSAVGGNLLRKAIAEEYFTVIAKAGFNVACCSAKAPFDLERVSREAQLAQKHGLFYLRWIRGKTGAGDGPKFTWDDGTAQNDASPNSDVLWDWMTEYVVGYAKVSRDVPSLIGTFVDFENYHAPKAGVPTLYTLSYDEKILNDFAKAKDITLPNPLPKERKAWLEGQNLHDAFAEFQIEHWRQRCRTLRKAVDEINPKFQFFICPGGGRSPFMTEAIYREWGTDQAPLVLASEGTYGRATNLTPQKESLDRNRKYVSDALAFLKKQNMPFQYIAGIDPGVRGADPEFCARNAVAISEHSNGYWVFYEGPPFGAPGHTTYLDWFGRANAALSADDYAFQHSERETPNPLSGVHLGMKLKPYTTEPMPAEAADKAFLVQFGHAVVVLLKAGEELRARIEVVELRKDRPPVEYLVVGPKGKEMHYGKAAASEKVTIKVKAEKSGLHCIAVGAGKLGVRLFVENQHACIIAATKPLRLFGGQPEAYFVPPVKASETKVTVRTFWFGSDVGSAELAIFHPDGSEGVRKQLLPNSVLEVKVAVPADQADSPWRLALTESQKGELLRTMIATFGPGCGRLLATHPSRLLVPAE